MAMGCHSLSMNTTTSRRRNRNRYSIILSPPVPEMQRGPFPLPSIDQARRWAGGYVHGSRESVEAVAQWIASTGDCVYHAVSEVFHRPCICQACRPDIKRYC